jgi:small subunit ribosomal protein S16
MVRIRLRRVGAKKQPSYRVVVADQRSPRDGRFIENIGHYNPRTDPPTVVIHEDRALYWLSVGARPSEAIQRFFNKLDLPAKLAKVHAGAAIEDVAEARTVPAKPAAAEETVVEKVKGKAKEAAAAVADMVEDVVEEVKEAAADVAEAIGLGDDDAEDASADETAAAEAVEDVVEEVAEDAAEAEEEAEGMLAEAAEAVEEAVEAVGDKVEAIADGALDLSKRVASSLVDAGIDTVAKLRAAFEGETLGDVPGIGPKAVDEIGEKLDNQGA